jgi:DNA polymerase III subunit epsilon
MSLNAPIFAFVDIETTGSRSNIDRITEVGVLTLENDEFHEWSSLINPETSIPRNIQQLTGITPDMVVNQPTFKDIASDLYIELKDKIFIAHNARFDYGFLKAEFKKVGIDFSPKVICTVKLSRKLFPYQARHNLDTLIQVHDLQVKNRHRALGDAQLLYQFWQKCKFKFGEDVLMREVHGLLGQTSLPSHIDQEMIDELPHKPGVYIFYAENKQPLYIGKSVDIQSRVRSHFHAALSNRKEMKLSLQVKDVDWIETGGELGALLLESRLIKEKLPSFNIKLRRSKDLCGWKLNESTQPAQLSLVRHREINQGELGKLYGLYYSQRDATKSLQGIAKKNHLCEGLLGLEKLQPGTACFGFHVKQCRGACIGVESPLLHDLRLKMALQKLKVDSWPYPGPIGIQEENDLHIFDHWCYLGTAMNESEVFELLSDGPPEFDLDIYKIIKKILKSNIKNSIRHLQRSQVMEFIDDVH